MKPFDLQRALAGDKVVNRGGTEVTQLTKFDCKTSFTVVGVMDGAVYTWKEDGRYVETKSCYDLFMAPKTVKRWVNFYGTQKSYHYDSEIKARRCAEHDAIAIAVPVEFEEGYGCE